MSKAGTSSKMPVYFLGIGGPNFIDQKDHPAFKKLQVTGREITEKVKPKAVVVFSAHWQESPTRIAVNVAEHTDIIYDFYGFPSHYYQHKYPYKGSPQLAETVIHKLSSAGIGVERVRRGLDHGVWVGFFAAFDPTDNPLNVPIVQVSLYHNEDLSGHYKLGQALQGLREEGVLIIGAGMAAHNLHDYRATRGSGEPRPYTTTFVEALTEATTTAETREREARMKALMERPDGRKAHPTLEHILPIYVAAGAAGSDKGHLIWAHPEASLNWAQYRFGDVASVS